MGFIGERRGRTAAAFGLLLSLVAASAPAWAKQDGGADGPAPVARIAVAPLGYVAPNPAYLNSRLSFNSLDFIDNNHLLFTFHVNRLLPRIAGDPKTDHDQMIHAVVLDIQTGKVLRHADWRMHDRGRYLWALKDGKFLVRMRNTLYSTDSTLKLHPYLTFKSGLQGVEVSPGRGLLMLEVKQVIAQAKNQTEGDNAERLPPSLESPDGVRRARTKMVLVRPGERNVLAGGQMLNPVQVPLLENGILNVEQGKKQKEWVIERERLGKTKTEVGTVKSSCVPDLTTLSDDVVLARSCPSESSSATDVSALSITGGVLWRDRWDSKFIWPQFASSEDGSRFVYETLEMNRPIGSANAFAAQDVVAQIVGVFDTKTGALALVKNASPVLSAGQNFALSADGRRFAILRNGAIEVYDLPPVSADVQKAASAKEK